jgi:hypothetical protein
MANHICAWCKKGCEELYSVRLSRRSEDNRLGWCSKECLDNYSSREAAFTEAREREQNRSMSDFQTGITFTPKR